MSLWGYDKGNLIEVQIAGEWKPCAVTGVRRVRPRGVMVKPLNRDGGPWVVVNPVRLRPLSQEALEAWLEAE